MQILCSYLLLEQAGWVYLDSPHWSRKKRFSFWPQINPLLTKLVPSRWLDIVLFLCVFIDLAFVMVHKNAKKKKANISQPNKLGQ